MITITYRFVTNQETDAEFEMIQQNEIIQDVKYEK